MLDRLPQPTQGIKATFAKVLLFLDNHGAFDLFRIKEAAKDVSFLTQELARKRQVDGMVGTKPRTRGAARSLACCAVNQKKATGGLRRPI